jgi:hypothetical protein
MDISMYGQTTNQRRDDDAIKLLPFDTLLLVELPLIYQLLHVDVMIAREHKPPWPELSHLNQLTHLSTAITDCSDIAMDS